MKYKKMDVDYQYVEGEFKVTEKIKEDFDDKGYLLLRSFLDKEELGKLKEALEHDEGILTKAYYISDGEKTTTKMCIWNHPGNDITGMLGRSEKVVNTVEELMCGEMYHYHTKMVMKEPFRGGQFLWHQDYGYWYGNGLLYPNMVTIFIAVDDCTKENGCMQIIPGSHKLGRIEHVKRGGQMEAEPERLQHVMNRIKPEYAEIEAGDAIIFHCNLLHTSTGNTSASRRWAFLMAYNRADNNPVKKHHHPRYVKINKVPNSAIKDCSTITDITNKGFIIQTGEHGQFKVHDDHLN